MKRMIPLFLFLSLIGLPPAAMRAASDPGPGDEASIEPAVDLPGVHFLQLEISWDFGDLGPPDWRKELIEDDPTARFLLRWKHSGPGFDSAKLTVYDQADKFLGELPLALDPPAGDGWRYTSFLIGDLPGTPTLTMRLRLVNAEGDQAGSASPEVQISAPPPDDPFLYTPLYILGIVTDTGIPGIAGGVSCGGGRSTEEHIYSAGVRKFDGGAGPVGSLDRWHWGSDTKAMTCTLLALLIQDGMRLPGGGGVLDWDTRLSGVFPEWAGEMHPRFIDTTLRHLACHRSGIFLNDTEWALASTPESVANPRNVRRDITHSVVTRQHFDPKTGNPTPVGVDFTYRNENYFILGAVIEQMGGARYEDLMASRIFEPLGMVRTGWGVPPEFSYYQPHGHRRAAEYPYEVYVDDITLFPPQAPAGALYCSIEDMLKFCRLHLNGTEGALSLLPTTRAELHTPYPKQFPDDDSYAWGWGASADGTRLGHDGSITTYYSRMTVDKNTGIVCVTATNIGGPPEEGGGPDAYGTDAVNLLHAHLVEKATAKCLGTPIAGSIDAGSGRSTGILESVRPEPEMSIDYTTAPKAPIVEGGYFPVSLFLSDFVARQVQAAARAPRVVSFMPVRDRTYRLNFTSEPGATYQLWGTPDLQPDSLRMRSMVEAADSVTGFDVIIGRDGPQHFYLVRDLFE